MRRIIVAQYGNAFTAADSATWAQHAAAAAAETPFILLISCIDVRKSSALLFESRFNSFIFS